MNTPMLEKVWQDKLLRYTILFSLKMIADNHTPPQEMADAIAMSMCKARSKKKLDVL